MAVPAALIAGIKAAVGPRGWSDDPAVVAPHLKERRGLYAGATPILVRPTTTAEVAAVVRLCAAHRTPVVPQGGNTGLVGGQVPDASGEEVLVALARLNRVRAIDPTNDTIIVEAGCVLRHVQEAAAAADRLFPLSLGAEGSCQIGGNIATNAGGVSVLRYGSARDLVLGLEVVLPDGRVWDGLRTLRKDNTGYDLKQLFIGGEGTLGIITAAALKLFPRPRQVATALAVVPDPAAGLEILTALKSATGNLVNACELIARPALEFVLRHIPGTTDPFPARHGWYLLLEVSSAAEGHWLRAALERVLAAEHEAGRLTDAVIATSTAQARALWRLRETIPEAEIQEGGGIKHDIAVPVSRVPEFIVQATAAVEVAQPGIRVIAFGHLGDGNIHFNLVRPPGADATTFLAEWDHFSAIVHGVAAALGGSISAEHGLGRLKREEIRAYKPAVEIELMRRVKAALDPDNLMNPGKLV
ncbi:MAG: FAD-binding oxidoreductase [Alphaproteobacteria bacterium]|nr:FAD-binding oxidoreductase [Alphaproteobacteria bacterium]